MIDVDCVMLSISQKQLIAPPDGCEQLMEYAPLVVDRYFPRYREIYARRGWTMFDSIDRVYDSHKAMRRLGFVCQTDFGDILTQLDREDGI